MSDPTSMQISHKLARRLFSRLLFWYLLLAGALTCIQIGIQYSSIRHATEQEVHFLAHAFGPSLSAALWGMDPLQLSEIARALESSPSITGVSVFDEDGKVLASVGKVSAEALRSGITPLRMPLNHANQSGQPIHVGEVMLHASQSVIFEQLRYSLLASFLNSLILAACLWMLFYWLIHKELSLPLAKVAEVIRHWRAGTESTKTLPPYPHQDELGDLLLAMGDARQRLNDSLAALNELNASLEEKVILRTEELSTAKQYLELSLAGGRLGCWSWNLDTNQTRFDLHWKQMLGYGPDEVTENMDGFAALIHPDDRARPLSAANDLIQGKLDQFRVDMRMRTRTGEYRWIQSCGEVTARTEDGRPVQLSGTHQDITERKQTEQALLDAHAENALILAKANQSLSQRVSDRTHELETANQALRKTLAQLESTHLQLAQSEKLATLGKLVALFAHDISTPISNSWMASGMLEENFKAIQRKQGQGTLRQRDLSDFLETVNQARQLLERNLERAHELLEGFKDMALDQATSNRRTIMLKPWLEQLSYTLSPMFKGKSIKLDIEIPCDMELDTCPGPLAQVITNLVSNALIHAFAPQNARDTPGIIRIQGTREADGSACLSVSDNGCGMSAELQNRIYEPFFTTRAGQGGTGLGLDIVRSIVVETLHGQIVLDSFPGQGSRFSIFLPQTHPSQVH